MLTFSPSLALSSCRSRAPGRGSRSGGLSSCWSSGWSASIRLRSSPLRSSRAWASWSRLALSDCWVVRKVSLVIRPSLSRLCWASSRSRSRETSFSSDSMLRSRSARCCARSRAGSCFCWPAIRAASAYWDRRSPLLRAVVRDLPQQSVLLDAWPPAAPSRSRRRRRPASPGPGRRRWRPGRRSPLAEQDAVPLRLGGDRAEDPPADRGRGGGRRSRRGRATPWDR